MIPFYVKYFLITSIVGHSTSMKRDLKSKNVKALQTKMRF